MLCLSFNLTLLKPYCEANVKKELFLIDTAVYFCQKGMAFQDDSKSLIQPLLNNFRAS